MHQLTGSLLCKRCRKAAKEAEDMQRNVARPIHWAPPEAAGYKDNMGWGPRD